MPHTKISRTVAVNPKFFVENRILNAGDDPCPGLLRFNRQEADTTYYDVIANGCVWIYTTDCNGNADTGIEYTCIKGNSLSVVGCHAIACNC
jgi:hypothetical protein